MKISVYLLLVSACVYSSEVIFKPSIKAHQKTLVLNGIGVREATIFKVDVYKAGLYLTSATKEAAAALSQPYPKRVEMHFVRDVSAEDFQKAMEEGFSKNCEPHCAALKGTFGDLVRALSGMKNGEKMAFDFPEEDRVVVEQGGSFKTARGASLAQTVLKLWLGEPPNSGLKSGMLGQAP